MQLKNRGASLRSSLIAASCALLGTHTTHADEADEWQTDTALLYYHENDDRVQVIEPVVNVKRDFGDDYQLGINLTVDSISGASPNGAIASRSTQTFSSPEGHSLDLSTCTAQTSTSTSGGGGSSCSVYQVASGKTPLGSFSDRRVGGGLSWQQPLGRLVKLSVGANGSVEHDFYSMSANATLARDFFSRNTTLSLSGAFEHDISDPVGGTPVAGSDYAFFEKTGTAPTRNVTSLLLGVSQVMNRRWLLQLNFANDKLNGYQTDPYKIISVVDSTGATTGYRFESRPNNRSRHGVYLENRIAVADDDVVTFSARRMSDSWGINSTTVDLRYRWQFDGGAYLEPHVRYYRQDAAEFYHLYLSSTAAIPQYFSADPRLAAFNGKTFGIKFGLPLEDGGEFSVRLELYRQTGTGAINAPGTLQGLDLYPGLTTEMLQVGWRF